MDLLFAINFSETTLLLFFILPFSYYAYSSQNWYLPDRVRLFNFIVNSLSVLLGMLVLFRIFAALKAGDSQKLLLMLLHLGPLVLALMAIARSKNMGLPGAIRSITEGGAQSESAGFKPKAVKSGDVEQVDWDDLIINAEVKTELMSVIELLKDPQAAKRFGITPPKGILFNGPPGTGKTTIARAVATSAGLSFFALRSDEIVSKWVGESEKNLSALFNSAKEHAPAVIFIDEIDSIGKKRSDRNASHSDNLLNHLLQLMDGVIKSEGLYIIGATNRAELVDEALKRAGRLNRVIEIKLPDYEARCELFRLYTRKLRLAPQIDLQILAKVSEGNSPADIKEICNQAGLHAFQRERAGGLSAAEGQAMILAEDFEAALEAYQVEEDTESTGPGKDGVAPINAQVEKLNWDDVVVDDEAREELESVVELLKDPKAARHYGIEVPKGILLNGPPGTGKTTIAKIIASTAGLSFFVLKSDEIISKYVGESEKNLTQLFKNAARHAPAVIFIDEIDSIGKNRAEGNAQHADSLLNHLLQLIDGVIKLEGVYIIAATNRGDLVDPALKRGGRLNRVIEIPLPGSDSRKVLFDIFLSKLKLAERPDFNMLAQVTAGKSPADIKSICNQAGLNAFRRESALGRKEYLVRNIDLEKALAEFLGPEKLRKLREAAPGVR